MIKKIFGYQIWNLVSVIILIAVTQKFISINYDTTNGELWGISTKAWFWIAIAIPIFHQVYVWIIWRLELYNNTFTSRYGLQRAFKIYTVGFSFLFICRLIFIIILAISNQGSLSINPLYTYLIYGLLILYLPGLLLLSKAALIVALFNHVYVWVHYYCTERPDMKVIYGKTP